VSKVKAGKQVTPERRLPRQRTEIQLSKGESKARRKLQSSLALSFYSLPSEDSPRREAANRVYEDLAKSLVEKGEDWRGEMDACSEALRALAMLDTAFAAVLNRVSALYDTRIQTLSDQLLTVNLNLSALHANFTKETDEKAVYKSKLERLSRENVELSQTCEAYQAKCFEFQEKLFDVACVELDKFPPEEKTWRLLISELDAYKAWKESASKELKAAKSRENKLVSLIHALKKRGFPVEEVYAKDVRKQAKSVRSSRSESSSEAEPLASGPPLVYQRPSRVPALSLEDVEREISSEESYQSSFSGLPYRTLSNSSTHSQLASSLRRGAVPQPDLPPGTQHGFQQEFMQKYEEFSQSWRDQIDSMHQ
jgi:hypothetical protein